MYGYYSVIDGYRDFKVVYNISTNRMGAVAFEIFRTRIRVQPFGPYNPCVRLYNRCDFIMTAVKSFARDESSGKVNAALVKHDL